MRSERGRWGEREEKREGEEVEEERGMYWQNIEHFWNWRCLSGYEKASQSSRFVSSHSANLREEAHVYTHVWVSLCKHSQAWLHSLLFIHDGQQCKVLLIFAAWVPFPFLWLSTAWVRALTSQHTHHKWWRFQSPPISSTNCTMGQLLLWHHFLIL